MPKENLIFKLDRLEYQYHHLNGSLDGFTPRLANTAKTFNAKGKKTSKRIGKLLSASNLEDVEKDLNSLRQEIIEKKSYHLENKLTSLLERTLQQKYTALKKKANDKHKADLETLKELDEKYTLSGFCKLISKSRTCKLLIAHVLPTKILKEEPPTWFQENEYLEIFKDKGNDYNPGKVWNEVVLPTKGCEKLLSQSTNDKKIKELLAGFENAMDLFMNLKRERSLGSKKEDAQLSTKSENSESIDNTTSGEQSEQDFDSSGSEDGIDHDEEDVDEEEILKQYEGMLVASDEEEDESVPYSLDPNVNYNEVTDEEPSDLEESMGSDLADSSEDEEPLKKRQKTSRESKNTKHDKATAKLPELMTGYFSGGSENELSEDEVAAQQSSNKPLRKNRRGQRARQKIWEKKFGKNAKHVQKQMEAERSERERKKVEYEQRVVKRAAKTQQRESAVDQKRIDAAARAQRVENTPIHPSWEAKKLAEEKQKGAKFQGKKIVF
ncbi:Bud22p [Lachancea thermotolerans CBS 6340]|uniref:KLTH0D07810p n=1 Tax=Lachancea thermotolerans (strain ATCC 56472 / CBS 6340 / NRRL Y-8284) TaxID=559295 RepID=C5DGS2_LACTC|nr:KLTH0D07810p [Lachancea thermotolerans CBS 6340]CAR22614.1 KLTH0D07810p [Lachancea thermotolerans CBS 6340]